MTSPFVGPGRTDLPTAGLHVEPDAEAAGFCVSRLERVTAAIAGDSESAEIPGAVVIIVRNGTLAYHRAFGFADRGARRPMRLDSVFRIASMTKPMTVVAALMLMEQGRLLLTDPVARHLPQLRDIEVAVGSRGSGSDVTEPTRRAMTVHDLMRHTAGFTYGQFGNSSVQRAYRAAALMDDQQTNADMVRKLAGLPLAFQPGTTFEYGMSTDVLGCIVEAVSGMDLERFFTENITGPLGMRDTAFGLRDDERQRLAEPQRAAAELGAPALVPYDPARPARWFSGGGGLLSTAADYARFAQMLLQQGELGGVRLLARKTVQLMTCNHLPVGLDFGPHTPDLGISAPLPRLGLGYGLGLGVRIADGLCPVPGSRADFFWGGALGPYFWVDPVENLTVIFMLQELDMHRRGRYRSLLRALVYQALS